MQTLYHVTTAEKAVAILQDGFTDRRGSPGAERAESADVPLSAHPQDASEGTAGDTVLAVSLSVPLWALTDFEVVEDGRSCREWCVPADLIDSHARITVADPSASPAGVMAMRPHGGRQVHG